MIFDFKKFCSIAAGVFPDSTYTFNEAMCVFRRFFAAYEEHTRRPHPPIKASQIARIIEDMPLIDVGEDRPFIYVSASDYPAIIDMYFTTEYKNCDYNINHFFSGKVRKMKYFEARRDGLL